MDDDLLFCGWGLAQRICCAAFVSSRVRTTYLNFYEKPKSHEDLTSYKEDINIKQKLFMPIKTETYAAVFQWWA
jgi:hypothetical protein